MPEVTQSAGEKAGTGAHSSLIPGSALSRVSEGRDGGPGWHCTLFPGPSTDMAHSGRSWLGGSGQRLPWSRAAAALPSLGPRWRCAHLVSPAPAGLHLQPRTQSLGRFCSVPQLPLPGSLSDQSSSYPLDPSLRLITVAGPQAGPALLPHPVVKGREGLTCVPGQTQEAHWLRCPGLGERGWCQGPTPPCSPFPCGSRAPSPHPTKPGVAIYQAPETKTEHLSHSAWPRQEGGPGMEIKRRTGTGPYPKHLTRQVGAEAEPRPPDAVWSRFYWAPGATGEKCSPTSYPMQ